MTRAGALDPRMVLSRRPVPAGEVVLKAARPLRRVPSRAPSAGEIEAERTLWGPHPDPLQSALETQLYALGHLFLRDFMRAVLGSKSADVVKADVPKPPGWGEVMALFKSPAPPAEKMATWASLVDGFTKTLLPAKSLENQLAMWALRSSLLSQIGARVNAVTTPGGWEKLLHTLPPAQQAQVEWAKIRGGQFVTNMSEKARAIVLDSLVESQMSTGNHHALARVLLERLGALNRDWRRIAITETGMAVASGQLATALASGGDWEAVWIAGPKACPFCRAHGLMVLQVVPADAPVLNGETMIWPGKNNVGRSASPFRKDGTKRGPDEIWWPCLPAHPNCACVWTLRRVVTSAAAKKAKATLDALLAKKLGLQAV